MRSTDILQSEHRIIELVLDCLEKMASQCTTDGKLDEVSARQAIEFFKTFADRCHHGKEENHFFPLMESRGFPREGGPTGVMRHEHDQGRKLIRAMQEAHPGAAAGQGNALRDFASHARAYVDLLRQHIAKEDHCLFPMAGRALSTEDDAKLVDQFAHSELHDVPSGAHEHYLEVARQLAERYQVPMTPRPACGHCSH